MVEMRKETDSLGVVEVPADKMWGRRPSAHSNTLASART
jgi:fumarate hydratase class II